jgi:hypothetical protein
MASAYHRKKGMGAAAEAGVSGSASGMSAQDVFVWIWKNGRYSTRSIVCYG